MPPFKDAYTEHQIKRWMRPDAHHFIRPDWRRFVKPGSELWSIYELYEHKYSADQPRVPAGVSEGGQWTSDSGGAGGGSSSPSSGSEPTAGSGRSDRRVVSDAKPYNYYKPGAHLAANEPQRLEPIKLEDEEARGGYTIDAHVNRSEEALKAQALAAFDTRPDAKDSRSGSFPSVAAANKLVNSTLAQNRDTVNLVATGMLPEKVVISQFSSVTGIEAVAPSIDSRPYIRETYGVGVYVVHDPYSSKGFRIHTAFPTNRPPQ